MWNDVGWGDEHSGQFWSVCTLHLRRLRGVGRQLAPAFSKKLSCPAGRPNWILRYNNLMISADDLIHGKGSLGDWPSNITSKDVKHKCARSLRALFTIRQKFEG